MPRAGMPSRNVGGSKRTTGTTKTPSQTLPGTQSLSQMQYRSNREEEMRLSNIGGRAMNHEAQQTQAAKTQVHNALLKPGK